MAGGGHVGSGIPSPLESKSEYAVPGHGPRIPGYHHTLSYHPISQATRPGICNPTRATTRTNITPLWLTLLGTEKLSDATKYTRQTDC